jgi:sirohydrochlorin ferrochelatase
MSPLGFVLVIHGSRYPGTAEQLSALVDALRRLRPGDRVVGAFLEILQPTVGAAIQQLVEEGSTTIVLLPYLMLDGRHSREDLPAMAREAETRHPNLVVRVAPPVGVRTEVLALLLAGAGAG